MGADLYIEKLEREKQYTGFKTDVEAGYYRDSYNDYSILYRLGLSWWVDIGEMIDKNIGTKHEGKLTPKQCKEFLEILEANKWKLEEIEEDRKFFKEKYRLLKKFLNKAIELNSDVICNI